MTDKEQVAILTHSENNELRIRLRDLAVGRNSPELAMNMKGALYCRKYGFDPLTVTIDELSDRNERYRTFRNLEIPPFADEPTKPCKAVETEKGVVLFSDDAKGNHQLNEYLQYVSDNFFKRELGINTLRLYELDIPLSEVPADVNGWFSKNPGADDFFAVNAHADNSILLYGNCLKTFDMRASGDNF